MNYMGFNIPIRAFLAGLDVAYHPTQLDAAECARWLEHYRAGISHGTQLCQFNQLNSHDTARFLTLLGGDRRRMKLALGWLFCWIGVPCLFYGDEIGLAGANDPFCRGTFPWDPTRWDQELLAHTRALAEIRRQSPALRRGALQLLYAEGETLIFVRLLAQERILVAIQRHGEAQLQLPPNPLLAGCQWQPLLSEGELQVNAEGLRLTLPESSLQLFQATAP